jgi:molecular chaperone GrpE (heat shock protein)
MNNMNNPDETKAVDNLQQNEQTVATDDPAVPASLENPQADPAAQLSEATNGGDPARLLNEMNEGIKTLALLLEEANRLATDRERIIDRLHQENQTLRQGELQQSLLPILRDSIRLYDDLKQTAQNYAERENLMPANVARDFHCFADTVCDILYRHGVESYSAAEGDAFNSKEHRVVSVVQTHLREKDRTIARTVREGFRGNSTVVRLSEAEVYKYVSDAVEENKADASNTR